MQDPQDLEDEAARNRREADGLDEAADLERRAEETESDARSDQ